MLGKKKNNSSITVQMAKKAPENLLGYLKKSPKLDSQTVFKVFVKACLLMKEICPLRKKLGMSLLRLIYKQTEAKNYRQAFTFEKEFVHNGPSRYKNKKFNSRGDYEYSKFNYAKSALSGFFSSILDDETREIKEEALELVTQVTLHFRELLESAFSYLLEVVNDEQQSTREKALEAVSKLVVLKELSFSELGNVYKVLNEDELKLREKAYLLLSKVKFREIEDFRRQFSILTENIRLFPGSSDEIFLSLKESCENNVKALDEAYLRKLLEIEEDYMKMAGDYLDLIYTAKFISLDVALVNGVKIQLPLHMEDHRLYFCNKYPEIFKSFSLFMREREGNQGNEGKFIEPKEHYLYKNSASGLAFPFYLGVRFAFFKENLDKKTVLDKFKLKVNDQIKVLSSSDLVESCGKCCFNQNNH